MRRFARVGSDSEAHVTKKIKSRFVPLPPSVVAEFQAIGGDRPFLMADAERPNGEKNGKAGGRSHGRIDCGVDSTVGYRCRRSDNAALLNSGKNSMPVQHRDGLRTF